MLSITQHKQSYPELISEVINIGALKEMENMDSFDLGRLVMINSAMHYLAPMLDEYAAKHSSAECAEMREDCLALAKYGKLAYDAVVENQRRRILMYFDELREVRAKYSLKHDNLIADRITTTNATNALRYILTMFDRVVDKLSATRGDTVHSVDIQREGYALKLALAYLLRKKSDEDLACKITELKSMACGNMSAQDYQKVIDDKIKIIKRAMNIMY
jgi:hypothetical protein